MTGGKHESVSWRKVDENRRASKADKVGMLNLMRDKIEGMWRGEEGKEETCDDSMACPEFFFFFCPPADREK